MRINLRACLIAAILLPAGCTSPSTQLPSTFREPPEFERQSYERFDPYPDENLGPDTMTRPRGFVAPRTMPRKAIEGRMLQGTQQGPSAPMPSPPPSSGNYPDAVR